MKLIYISNTRLPSEKANSYQSMVMCESFAKNGIEVEFWHPKRKNPISQDPFEFYQIKKNFKLKEIFSIDNGFMKKISEKYWFILQNISFAFCYSIKLMFSTSQIVFTRDLLGLKVLSLLKKYKLVNKKFFFELHEYNKKYVKYLKFMDGIITQNFENYKLLKQHRLENILYIQNGVKLSEYQNIHPKKNKDNVIVYVGNLFEWKGVYTLAESMKYLKDMKLIVVGGSKEELQKYKNYISLLELSNIEIVGFVKKVETIKYIKKADVLVLPNSSKDKMSYYTSPLKLFEYMASKRIIVASKLPSIEEVLQDKKNAVLFEADNPKDLANKIKWCFENDTSEIVEQAYQDVQEYTWDKRAEKIKRWINGI